MKQHAKRASWARVLLVPTLLLGSASMAAFPVHAAQVELNQTVTLQMRKVNAARKSKVDDNTARMQSIKQLGV